MNYEHEDTSINRYRRRRKTTRRNRPALGLIVVYSWRVAGYVFQRDPLWYWRERDRDNAIREALYDRNFDGVSYLIKVER